MSLRGLRTLAELTACSLTVVAVVALAFWFGWML